jgi:ABC-type dipeptide/oligopeptide/nickel transport system permease component
MLRDLLRRLLWLAPTLVVLVVGAFSLVDTPRDPATDPAVIAEVGVARAEELRDERGIGLPRFFEPQPDDLASRTARAVTDVVVGGPDEARGAAELVRLGGAALPLVLPRIAELPPAARFRLALALAPLAARMQLDGAAEAADPARALRFWTAFWEERAGDFRPNVTARALRRYVEHGSGLRAGDLLARDTYAIPEAMRLVAALDPARDADAIRRVLELIGHATGRDDVPREGATPEDVRDAVTRWQAWAIAHRGELRAYAGVERLAASLLDTRFGRWLEQAVRLRLGLSSDGEPVLRRLRDHAGPTLAIAALATLLAALAAVPLGALAARLRTSGAGAWTRFALLLAESVPTAVLATALAALARGHAAIALSALALAAALVAAPARQHRAALLETLHAEWVRAARALGAGPVRLVLGPATRAALVPTIALLTVELPETLTGAFVAERAFGLSGLADETLHAVRTHDVAFLMALALAGAVLSFLVLLLGDVALAAIDPRLGLGRRRRKGALA